VVCAKGDKYARTGNLGMDSIRVVGVPKLKRSPVSGGRLLYLREFGGHDRRNIFLFYWVCEYKSIGSYSWMRTYEAMINTSQAIDDDSLVPLGRRASR
jgi:hypothetical protein